MMSRLPWYKFYSTDWLTSPTRYSMTLAERGLYRDILDLLNTEGRITSDEQALIRMLAVSTKEFRQCWPRIRQELVEDGEWLVHPKARELFSKRATFHEQQSERGKKGGRPKANALSREKPRLSENKANAKAEAFNSRKPLDAEADTEAEKTHTTRARAERDASDFNGYHPDHLAYWLADNYPKHLQTKPGWRNVLGEICISQEIEDRIRAGLEACKRSAQWKRGVIPQLFNWLSRLEFDAPPPENEKENDPDPYGIRALQQAGKHT